MANIIFPPVINYTQDFVPNDMKMSQLERTLAGRKINSYILQYTGDSVGMLLTVARFVDAMQTQSINPNAWEDQFGYTLHGDPNNLWLYHHSNWRRGKAHPTHQDALLLSAQVTRQCSNNGRSDSSSKDGNKVLCAVVPNDTTPQPWIQSNSTLRLRKRQRKCSEDQGRQEDGRWWQERWERRTRSRQIPIVLK